MELESFLNTRNVELPLFDLECYCIRRAQALIKQKGPTYVLSLIEFQEDVLSQVDTNNKCFDLLIKVLRDKLSDLTPSRSLILVDRFVFAKSTSDRPSYLKMFEDIFGQVVNGIEEIKFVTSPDHDTSLYQDVQQLLRSLNHQVVVECNTTEDFHDRFWIVDEAKGLFVGTSLNGIGKRYALVDNMRDEDTKTIVGELRRRGLI
jgi:hypothetical protein